MPNKKAMSVFLGMLFMLPAAFAANENIETPQAANNVSIHGLIEEALTKSPAVQAKTREYEAAKDKIIDAWLLEDPEFGVDVESQKRIFDFGTYADNEYMIQQSIPFPTKLFLRGMIAAKKADTAFQKEKEVERDTTWHIEQPYYELFLAEKETVIFEENKTLLEQLIKSARARYESGQGAQGDLLKAQIELSKTEIEIFNRKQKENLAQAHFSHILNRPLNTHYDIVPEAQKEKITWSLGELEKLALQKRPELRAAALLAEEAGLNRNLSQQSWLPDITLRYEGRQFKGQGSITENDTFIGVTVPIWSILKGVGGDWHAAEMDAQAAQADYETIKNETLLKIHESYSKAKSAENALEIYENNILPQAKQQVDVALSSYEAGKSDFLTVIDAERTLRDSQMEYYRSLAEYEMGLSDLRLAVGDSLNQDTAKVGTQ